MKKSQRPIAPNITKEDVREAFRLTSRPTPTNPSPNYKPSRMQIWRLVKAGKMEKPVKERALSMTPDAIKQRRWREKQKLKNVEND